MEKSSFSILISTINYNIHKIDLKPAEGVTYVVVHQVSPDFLGLSSFDEIYKYRKDVIYKKLSYMGLSASRNVAISLCPTKYGYIMDDDVSFDLSSIQFLVSNMKNDAVDVATCQYSYPSLNVSGKYDKNSYLHTYYSAAKVSSIEICINVDMIKRAGISFDTNFGLGSLFPSGEEYIFLTDCLRSRLVLRYYPIVTCIHPELSSGVDFYTTYSKAVAKREMLKRIFGSYSIFYIFGFWIKKLPLVLGTGYAWTFTKAMLLGR